jgi:hypothetical protein
LQLDSKDNIRIVRYITQDKTPSMRVNLDDPPPIAIVWMFSEQAVAAIKLKANFLTSWCYFY